MELLVEDSNGTRDAYDDERLAGEEREENRAQDRCEQDLIDAIARARTSEHVEREGEGGKDAVRRQSRYSAS